MNIYYHNNEFNNSKYTKWYYSIIKNALSQERSRTKYTYFEKHHILPKSIFPEYKTEKWNLVFLTAREHFIVHCLLVKMTEKRNRYKMSNALKWFTNNKIHKEIYSNSRLYEKFSRYFNHSSETKEKMKGLKSDSHKKKMKENHADFNGKKNPFYGKKHKEESKEKIKNNHANCKGANNGMFGKTKELCVNFNKIWITNGFDNKMVYKNEVIEEGWKKGRTIIWNLNKVF